MTTLTTTLIKRLTSKDFVSRETLLTFIRLNGFDISDRYMRELITQLRDKHGALIVSSNKGYKLATSKHEFEAHIKYKKSYALSILRECRLMKRNFQRSIKPQLYA